MLQRRKSLWQTLAKVQGWAGSTFRHGKKTELKRANPRTSGPQCREQENKELGETPALWESGASQGKRHNIPCVELQTAQAPTARAQLELPPSLAPVLTIRC